eukprot:3681279-Prymnesium_polylepis.1
MQLCSPAQPLLHALLQLGVPPATQAHTLSFLQAEGADLAGAAVRARQLADGVERRFIERDDALRLVREQPQIFRLRYGTVFEDDHIVCIDKPNDVLLRLSEKPGDGGGGGAPSVHSWLAEAHPSVVTETGTTR